jgi:hypothetical protein
MDRVALPWKQDSGGWNFDSYMNQDAPTSADEAVQASKDLAAMDTVVGKGTAYWANRDLESLGGKQLSPDEANAQLPVPVPYTKPVNAYVAQQNFDQNNERLALQHKVENGPDDLWTRTRMFGAGLIAHAMDPVEFGVGAASGWGVGRILARPGLAAATGLGQAASGLTKAGVAVGLGEATAGRVAGHVVEAGVGNALQSAAQSVETGVVADDTRQEFHVGEQLKEAAVNTLFGTALHLGIKEGGNVASAGFDRGSAQAMKIWRNLMKKAPEMDRAVLAHGVGAVEQMRNPDIGPLVESVAKQTDVRGEDFGGKFQYEYQPLTPEAQAQKPFFMPAESPDPASARQIGDEIGIGRQMTDHPGVANAASEGSVIQMDAKDLRPLSLNESSPPELHGEFRAALEGVVENPEKFVAESTPKDVFNELWRKVDEGEATPETVQALQEQIKAKGYNSLLDDGAEVLGQEHQPHNLITLLDDEAAKPAGHFATDPEVRGAPSDETVARVQEENLREGGSLRDETPDNFEDIRPDPLKDTDAEVRSALEEADLLDKQGLLDPETKAEWDMLRTMADSHELEQTALKAIAKCMGM